MSGHKIMFAAQSGSRWKNNSRTESNYHYNRSNMYPNQANGFFEEDCLDFSQIQQEITTTGIEENSPCPQKQRRTRESNLISSNPIDKMNRHQSSLNMPTEPQSYNTINSLHGSSMYQEVPQTLLVGVPPQQQHENNYSQRMYYNLVTVPENHVRDLAANFNTNDTLLFNNIPSACASSAQKNDVQNLKVENCFKNDHEIMTSASNLGVINRTGLIPDSEISKNILGDNSVQSLPTQKEESPANKKRKKKPKGKVSEFTVFEKR
mmetsp:Transcript_24706/g.56823  ORF Transcript_24706/g.56823 Transcript_24706/m.56823 type:complete len:264 (+) Transcript_24706:318-1109(+)